jgi:hypothetical protein
LVPDVSWLDSVESSFPSVWLVGCGVSRSHDVGDVGEMDSVESSFPSVWLIGCGEGF